MKCTGMQWKKRNPLPDDASTAVAGSANPPGDIWSRLPRPLTGALVPVAALVATSIATLLGAGLSRWLPQQSIALVYMVVVVVMAVGLGVRTGMAVAMLSCLAFNFFFIPPVFTFTIADPQELFALIVFLAVALLTGSLAGRMREVADDARHRSTALQSLNEFAGKLSGSRGLPAILDALAEQAAETTRGEAVVLTGNAEELKICAAAPTRPTLAPVDFQAAQRAYRSGETAHAAAPGWTGAKFEFHPIKSTSGTLGVVGIAAREQGLPRLLKTDCRGHANVSPRRAKKTFIPRPTDLPARCASQDPCQATRAFTNQLSWLSGNDRRGIWN